MEITPEGTLVQVGDPCFISMCITHCPLCGRRLNSPGLSTFGGHLHTNLGPRAEHVMFGACTEHSEEAKLIPVLHAHHESMGYLGEWVPKYGLAAEISYNGVELDKHVILIKPPKQGS